MFGAVLLLTTAAPARADVGVTDAVAAAFLTRTVDAQLHEVAHQRVAELSACRCLDHDGIRPGTAEVLALSEGVTNPAAHAVTQWIGSPTHNAILSNASYGRIGCADGVAGDVHYLACVLAAGPLPAQPGPVAPSVISLPDTALPPMP